MPVITNDGSLTIAREDAGQALPPQAGEQLAKLVTQQFQTLSSSDIDTLTIGIDGTLPVLTITRIVSTAQGTWQWTMDTSNNLTLNRTVGTGTYVFNELGGDVDFRWEGDTDTELLFLDASTDRIGISLTNPSVLFHVGGVVAVDGNLFVGDTANAGMTLGLTIKQAANTDEILALKASDVDHSLTSVAETDTYFSIRKSELGSGAVGGIEMRCIMEDANLVNVWLTEVYGGQAVNTKTSAGDALVEFFVAEHDGAGNLADITADGNVFAVRARVGGASRSLFIVDEDGDLFADGGTTTTAVTVFDEHDDAQLIRAFDMVRAPEQAIRTSWDEHVRYNEQTLVDCGILGAPIAEGGLVCITQLQRLHNGAIWQAYVERQELLERLEAVERKLLIA